MGRFAELGGHLKLSRLSASVTISPASLYCRDLHHAWVWCRPSVGLRRDPSAPPPRDGPLGRRRCLALGSSPKMTKTTSASRSKPPSAPTSSVVSPSGCGDRNPIAASVVLAVDDEGRTRL
uniref:Uncharacterized protein n=1 Tax=Oryza meridionalis TaxID=40149 RepID=A0A0E0C3J0_9ORYZ